jgi:hypothetical protein
MTGAVKSLRVFLCHASGDRPAVRELYGKLSQSGFQPWLDEEDLLAGQKWEREIPIAVKASDVVFVCLSRVSIGKQRFVQKEIKFALDVTDEHPDDAIFVIPIRLEEREVPQRLSQWQWVNLYEDRGYEKLVKPLEHRARTLRPAHDKGAPKGFTTPGHSRSRQAVADQTDSQDADGEVPRRQEAAPGRMFKFETVTLDGVGNVTSRFQKEAGESLEDLAPKITLEMVAPPGGTFMMGSPKEEEGSQDDKRPRRKVTLSPFHMGKFAVTQSQWRVVAGWPKLRGS